MSLAQQRHGSALAAWGAELRQLAPGRDSASEEERRAWSCVERACLLLLLPDESLEGASALLPRRGDSPRRALAAEFDGDDLASLAASAASGVPAALRARVNDLVWTLERDPVAGMAAFEAYLEVALTADLGQPAQAVTGGDALLRATRLALEGRDLAPVEAALVDVLPRALSARPPIALHRFLQAAHQLPGPESGSLADLAIARAERELSRREFRWGRTFYAHAERSLAAAGRSIDSQTLSVVRASVLADEARFLAHVGEPAWVPCSFLKRAVDELVLIPGSGELATALLRERNEQLVGRPQPPELAAEDGRLSTALEDVVRAVDEVEPLLAARVVGLLPLEPDGAAPAPSGPAVLDDFLRRFRARARGRFLPREEPASAADTRVDPERVESWACAATTWFAPLLDALRRHAGGDPRARDASCEHLLAEARGGLAERARPVARGLRTCFEGEPRAGLELLVEQLLHLREDAEVRALLAASPALAIVDAALLDHPRGLRLTSSLAKGGDAGRLAQAAADLALWWTLCLAVRLGGQA